MNLIPLRTAAIAGACTVALSFVALPARAAVPFDDLNTSTTSDTTPAPDSTDSTPAPDSTDSTPADDSSVTDDTGTDDTSATDDSGDMTDDSGDDVGDDDGSDDSSDPTTVTPALPKEKGSPKQHFEQTVFTPKEIATKGLKITYTGLTAGKSYQPFEATENSGGELTDAKKADKKGTLTVHYKFKKSEESFTTLGATYAIGLNGVDTDVQLRQTITVKYDSDLTWNAAARHGGKVTLSVNVDKDNAAGKSADWKKADVDFQKKVGSKWVTVKTVKTNAKGVATATVKSGRSVFRAVLDAGKTVIGATTKGHRA